MYRMYTVTAVAELTGLTPETLRAWERRHGVVMPSRDAAGRRIYDAAAVGRLARLKRLTDRGHAIRRLVELDDSALDALEREAATAAAAPDANAPLDALRRRMFEAVRAYRADDLDRMLGVALATVETPVLVVDVLAPLLREIGQQWADGTLDIAQERLLSSALRTRVLALLNQRERVPSPVVLLATLSGERHELGLLLVAMLALFTRVPFEYLGTDLPAEEIARAAEHLGVRVVAVSLVCTVDVDADARLETLRNLLPPDVALWIGGAGADALERSHRDVVRFDELPRVEQALRRLLAGTGAGTGSE
jgi:MerR family transcriptional regulator, light-induced transcriptional regulator